MQTTSETILLITVWALTGIGFFFGLRSKLRKRRKTRNEKSQTNNLDGSN